MPVIFAFVSSAIVFSFIAIFTDNWLLFLHDFLHCTCLLAESYEQRNVSTHCDAYFQCCEDFELCCWKICAKLACLITAIPVNSNTVKWLSKTCVVLRCMYSSFAFYFLLRFVAIFSNKRHLICKYRVTQKDAYPYCSIKKTFFNECLFCCRTW